MSIDIPFSNRSRKFGYLYWQKRDDSRVFSFFGDRDAVVIVFQGYLIGEKRIDRKYRRISLGWSKTRKLPESVEKLRLKRLKDGKVEIKCL
jgi:hypothetical protein